MGPSSSFLLGSLFVQSHWLVKLVIMLLLVMSIICWAIIFYKYSFYKKMRQDMQDFETKFWSGGELDGLYRALEKQETQGKANIFMAAMTEWRKSLKKGARSAMGLQMRVEKAMSLAIARQEEEITKYLPFLASTGSCAPFIGLFGTVIGILSAFQSIGLQKSTSLAVIAPAISEALLSTAIGLLVAIPAVIAYNKLRGDAMRLVNELDAFSEEFSSIVSREIDGKVGGY